MFQVEEPLLSSVANINVANIKTELFSFNDTPEDQAGTASSYFSQVGSGLESKDEASNLFVPADLFQSSQDFALPQQQQQQLPEQHQQLQEPKKEEKFLQQQQQQQQQPSEDVTAWYQSEFVK